LADSDFLTPKQIAEDLQVHIETVYTWIREKKLIAVRLSARDYRISKEDYEDFLSKRKTDRKE
jgi:excisionase family DNA binding protein